MGPTPSVLYKQKTQHHGISHKLTAAYQFDKVKEAAVLVESGGTVSGSITDNHRVNQQFCKMFNRPNETQFPLLLSTPWMRTGHGSCCMTQFIF